MRPSHKWQGKGTAKVTERLQYYSVLSLPCFSLICSLAHQSSLWASQWCLWDWSTAHSSRWLGQGPDEQYCTFLSLQGQDRLHPRVLRKLTNVTVIQVSSSKGHSSQVKYPGSNLYSQKIKCLINLTMRGLTQKDEGRTKIVIYHKFREFLAICHSVLVIILNQLNHSYRKNRDQLISEIHSKSLRWKKHKL